MLSCLLSGRLVALPQSAEHLEDICHFTRSGRMELIAHRIKVHQLPQGSRGHLHDT